jgi:hypothetical protein
VKKNMRWTTYYQITEVGDEKNYLGVTLENRGWNKQKTRITA